MASWRPLATPESITAEHRVIASSGEPIGPLQAFAATSDCASAPDGTRQSEAQERQQEMQIDATIDSDLPMTVPLRRTGWFYRRRRSTAGGSNPGVAERPRPRPE